MIKRVSKTAVLVMALIMVLAVSAFALNYGGGGTGSGNKSFGFNGYEIVDSTHIKVFFNKTFSTPARVDLSQFSYKPLPSGSATAFSNISTASGNNRSGVSGTNLTNGSSVTLTTASALSADTRYELKIQAATLSDNNKITLANYTNKQELVFNFKTKNNSGNYTGEPEITLLAPTGSTIPRENNVMFVVDRPVREDEVSGLLSNMNSNFSATKDPDIDDTAVDGAVCYTARANDARTAFFFPLTGNGSSTIAYNLPSYANYVFTMPSFYDASNNYYPGASQISFTSWSGDIAMWNDKVPTATKGTSNGYVNVSIDQSSLTGAGTNYKAYYRLAPTTAESYKYGTASDWQAGPTLTGSGPFTGTITGLQQCSYYYVRVVPVDANGYYTEAGFTVPSARVQAKGLLCP